MSTWVARRYFDVDKVKYIQWGKEKTPEFYTFYSHNLFQHFTSVSVVFLLDFIMVLENWGESFQCVTISLYSIS